MPNEAGGVIVIKDLYSPDSSRKVESVLNCISLCVTDDMPALVMQRQNQTTSLGELLYRAVSRDSGCNPPGQPGLPTYLGSHISQEKSHPSSAVWHCTIMWAKRRKEVSITKATASRQRLPNANDAHQN